MQIFVLAVLSGCHIAFGAFLLLSVGAACPGIGKENPGLQKILMGAFGLPFGLMMTVIGGGELFTGNTALVGAALIEKKTTVKALLKNWSVSYAGNFVGSLLMACLVHVGGTLALGPAAVNIAVAKTSLPFAQAVVRGILCNWLVCMAVYMASGASSLAGKMTAIFFPISAFVALGLEHSIANMFLIPIGMLRGAAGITVADFLLKNILPVTLGNIVGGVVAVAGGYAASYGALKPKPSPVNNIRGGFVTSSPFVNKIKETESPTAVFATTEHKLTKGSDYLSEETLERAKVGNPIEKAKIQRDPTEAWTDIHDFAAAIRAGTTNWEDIAANDIDVRVKYAGLFHRKKRTPGKFMMRLRLPNGIVTSEQMRFFAESVRPYGPDDGVVDVTTRANIQLRGMPLEAASDIVMELQKRGMTSLMSGLDNVRNMVGSPIAGIDPHEIFDTRALCKLVDDNYSGNGKGNPEWSNMPRKFNIAISGSRDDFSHTHINDIGLNACPHATTGEVGFIQFFACFCLFFLYYSIGSPAPFICLLPAALSRVYIFFAISF
jgi:formate/nitrite transporter